MATSFKESVTLQKVSVLFVVFYDGLPLRLGLPPQCNGGDGDYVVCGVHKEKMVIE